MNYDGRLIFCFDTSAFVTLHRYYSAALVPDLWILLDDLAQAGRLITHRAVYSEIVPSSGPKDDLGKWLHERKHICLSETQAQLDRAAEILAQFPRLIDPQSEKEQADPWIIALVLEKVREPSLFAGQLKYAVVSTESEKSAIKIPAVCKHYGILHLNLFEFFAANGVQFNITRHDQ